MTSITFLGTGGDNYITSRCIRNSGGIIIKHDELQLHLDPGPNSLLLAKNSNIKPRATTAVIVSSPKLDMSNDINAVINAMTYGGDDPRGIVIAPEVLFEGSENENPLIRKSSIKCIERSIISVPEKKIGIENIDIIFIETKSDQPNIGMKIYMPDLVIGYSSDTAYSDKIAKQYVGCDIMILSVIDSYDKSTLGRMSSKDAISFINVVKPKLTLLTRFGKSMLEQDPLLEARKIHSETKAQVMAVVDGQSISPVSYSASGKQRQIKNFYK